MGDWGGLVGGLVGAVIGASIGFGLSGGSTVNNAGKGSRSRVLS